MLLTLSPQPLHPFLLYPLLFSMLGTLSLFLLFLLSLVNCLQPHQNLPVLYSLLALLAAAAVIVVGEPRLFCPNLFSFTNFTLANCHARSINKPTAISNGNPTVQSFRLLTAVASIVEQFLQTLSLQAVNVTFLLAGIILVIGVMASGQSQAPGTMSVQNIEEIFSLPSRDHSNKIIQVPIYKLKTSLNKAGLQEELVKFSHSSELWVLSKPGAQRPHKGLHGPKPGTKKAAKLTNASASISDDNDENLDILAWADALSLKCPSYYKPWPPRKVPELKPIAVNHNEQFIQELHSMWKTVNVIASYIIPDPNRSASVQSQALVIGITFHTDSHTTYDTSLLLAQQPLPPLPSMDINRSQLPVPPIPLPSSMDVDQIQSPVPTPPYPTPTPTMSMTTVQGLPSSSDELVMSNVNLSSPMFANAQVKKLLFSKKVEQLRKIWDDELLHEFDPNDCPLKVNGIPIALKYWDRLYSHKCHNKSDKRWKGYKSQWHEWKYVAEYLLARTTNEFWAEFTDSKTGQRMSYTAIRKEL
ncbi:hypothetical protein Moror_9979 [Moniliophthora roreri MCA 2997]|uniref:Uncharacterized protein n=1 Tax=Moniliophthora roreri (strain MCA 2997) TaxID=1381753 RepID=V2WZP5_MONRO|nr:hypothetical protein Moror_9979 [Moniliophthora roreri MCA 2997]